MNEFAQFQLDKWQLAKAFSRAAKQYDALAVLQREVGMRLLQRLPYMRLQPSVIVDLGSGTGSLTRQLEKQYPKAKIIAVDLALGMSRYAKRRSSWFSKQRYLCADAENLPIANQSVDLIFSNLMLHCSNHLDQIFAEVQRVLKPQGLFIFSTYGPDTLRELRQSWQQIDDYNHVHAFIDMHDIGDSLIRAKLADPVMDVEYFTVTYRDIFLLLRELKQVGEQNVSGGRRRTLTGKSRIYNLQQAYETFRNAQGLFPVTYEVIYGHAWGRNLTHTEQINIQGQVHIPIQNILRLTSNK